MYAAASAAREGSDLPRGVSTPVPKIGCCMLYPNSCLPTPSRLITLPHDDSILECLFAFDSCSQAYRPRRSLVRQQRMFYRLCIGCSNL